VVLSELKEQEYIKNTRVWLYRGAWDDFETYDIEMAVPMSPAQMQKKIHAIFYHQTQKDNVMFKGEDSREFWQRVEQRNMELAQKYNKLGLADYEAIESFKQLEF
jgi:glucosamine-6-phosphate deaminase